LDAIITKSAVSEYSKVAKQALRPFCPGELSSLSFWLYEWMEVSGTENIRDELQGVVRDHLADGVSFFELGYQPLQK
jgi:hypothetical protein